MPLIPGKLYQTKKILFTQNDDTLFWYVVPNDTIFIYCGKKYFYFNNIKTKKLMFYSSNFKNISGKYQIYNTYYELNNYFFEIK